MDTDTLTQSTPSPMSQKRTHYTRAVKITILQQMLGGKSPRQIHAETGINLPSLYTWRNNKKLMNEARRSLVPVTDTNIMSLGETFSQGEKPKSFKSHDIPTADFVNYCPGCGADIKAVTQACASLNFCPGCGTNVKSVAVAMQTYKQIAQNHG